MDQSDTTHPPMPNVNPLAVKGWVAIEDERGLSTVDVAIMRNLEFLATQNQSIMQTQEKILEALNKKQGRRSSLSSTGTAVTETTDGDDLTGVADQADPTVIAAFEALNNPTGDMNIALTETHQAFMDDTGNKLYVKRTITATRAAMSFRDHIGETFSVESSDDAASDSDHDLKKSIVDHLAILNSDLVTAIYINLNKAMKARKSKSKKGGVAATRASTPAEATQDILSSPLAHRVRRSTGRIFVSSDSEEPAGASTPKANPGHSDENSQQTQVSLTSVEVRRSNQTLRFESESEGEGDDDEMRG
ncbi:hypothetical protein NXS19_013962 [Fusarium pseudograminearum]|uniref:Uncharacterized protein n=1 Tax=Fusarium pseudograminearum (strain CS3096) TaxID=1028729 RepID=K3V7R3_FUSPC|nr:hypothetical protein FPSE_10221 [Fusarium pseudograminearum CS3096]EKJ69592.1 hypothetical protein FPSE_10221 [Fusarium pseudograminearum CS3096]KAF0636845.1 hypothetical protein FPSE5266_10221 [Fusarium pseudograminearum]UZP46150.1 hypothetical protein NXS19_013962 [Fusarium pseudograminearum]